MTELDLDQMVRDWWSDRTEDQRKILRQEAEQDRMTQDTVRLLIDTRCPVGPVGTKWEMEPGFHWTWADRVQEIILGT